MWSTTPAQLRKREKRRREKERREGERKRGKSDEVRAKERWKATGTAFFMWKCVWGMESWVYLACHSRRISHRTHWPRWRRYWVDSHSTPPAQTETDGDDASFMSDLKDTWMDQRNKSESLNKSQFQSQLVLEFWDLGKSGDTSCLNYILRCVFSALWIHMWVKIWSHVQNFVCNSLVVYGRVVYYCIIVVC